MSTPLITLTDVAKTFPPRLRGGKPVHALQDTSLEIERGDIYGIIGYSGAGKSTLARLINSLEKSTSGSIVIDGVETVGLAERELRRIRLGIGMIFQQFNLFTSRTVWGNIAYPLTVAGVPKEQHQQRISDLLHFVGLADKAHSYPDELSGGQKQRVGIARALATSPKILLADEATSALDPETTRDVLALLRRVNEEFGVTIVVITHEMEVIRSIAHKVAVMEAGRIIERGPVFDVFSAPKEEATRGFVSTVVRAIPEGEERELLLSRHPGRVVTLSFTDGDVSQSAAFLEFGRHEVGFELIYGGINDIRGRTFGHLTLALTGDPEAIEAALGNIRATVAVTEVS